MQPDSEQSASRRRLQTGLMVAVFTWGTALAVGAVQAFRARGDVRQGLIIFGCVVGFLAFWTIAVVWFRRRAAEGRVEPQAGHLPPFSWAGMISTVLGLVAAAGMSVASSWITTTLEVRELALVGVGSVVSLGIALVAALVGLSQPQPRRLKWLGLTPLIVSVVLLGCWLV